MKTRMMKEKYLANLSEDAFRDEVVRELFLRIGYCDGRELCGPEEHGRDSLFTEKDTLGSTQYVALQTKKGKISLASSLTKSLQIVLGQLRTALETNYSILFPEKKKIKPNKVILCASETINDAARNHIVDELDDRVTFIDAHDLIPLIDQRFPELWVSIEASIEPYLAELRKLALPGSTSSMRSEILTDNLTADCLTDEGYIDLHLVSTDVKPKRDGRDTVNEPVFDEILSSRLLSRPESLILILGEAGSGKSTLLLRLAFLAATTSVVSEKNYVIPVLFKAPKFQKLDDQSFIEYLEKTTSEVSKVPRSAFSMEDLQSGRVMVIVDALDELNCNERRDALIQSLADFHALFPKCKVIVSARPYTFLRKNSSMRVYKRFRISSISVKESERIIQRQLDQSKSNSSESQNAARELLRKVDTVHGFELNPLLVTVFAAVTRGSVSELPANVTELFKKYSELMLGRWDEKKGMGQQIQAHIKDFVLCRIAFRMHSERKTQISRHDFQKIGVEILEERGREVEAPILLEEILNRSSLFRQSDEIIEFRHHLIQEFFAGRGIPDSDFLPKVLSDDWWRKAVVFYFGERPTSLNEMTELIMSVHATDPSERFEIAATIGLALQAVYLGDAEQKLDIWKWVADTFTCELGDYIDSSVDYKRYPVLNFLACYLFSRDSVALALLPNRLSSIKAWLEESEDLLPSDLKHEGRLFWLITALLEVGSVSAAQPYVDRLRARTKDDRLLLAIHCGSALAEKVRYLGDAEQEQAREIQSKLRRRISPLGAELLNEIGTQLLEMRRGEIFAIDAESEEENMVQKG